MPQMLA